MRPLPPGFLALLTKDVIRIAIYNTAIAILLTLATDHGFWSNFVYSQAIGLGIVAGIFAVHALRGGQRPGLIDVAVGLPAGAIVGFALGTWGNGLTLVAALQSYPRMVLVSAGAALMFGLIASAFFFTRSSLDEAREEARTERLRRAEQEALASQADLRLLQAQIEPHFLFNTLSVIVELVDTRPSAARSMLLNLVSLLRASLANTRRETVRFDEELDLLRAYLEIMAERMGPRLRYRIDTAPEAAQIRMPPLLVQPLVENAIRHGLEPKAEGGEVVVRGFLRDGALVVEVVDSGRGFTAAPGSEGVGLANVRRRLASRYGPAASLDVAATAGGGVTARIVMPATEA